MKEYKTIDGHLFYSDWAFDVNSSVATTANAIAFKSLDGRYKKCSPASAHAEMAANPGVFVFTESCPQYGRRVFHIKANPEHLSFAEMALICDGGNLCFGYSVEGNTINIYTD